MNWQRQTTLSYGSKQGFPRSPMLGRMLSPDPVVQAPDNLQNYNRYSYVLNNPLKYTDPTGYQVNRRAFDAFGYPSNDGSRNGSDYLGTRGGGGGGYSSYWSRPGVGGNGTGEGGYYYDYSTDTYRSTADGSGVGWGYATSIAEDYGKSVSSLIFSGTKENPYQNLRGIHYSDRTTWYAGEGFSGNIVQASGGELVQVPGEVFHAETNTIISGPLGKNRYKTWVQTIHTIIAESYISVLKDWVKIASTNVRMLKTPNILTAYVSSTTLTRETFVYGPPAENMINFDAVSNFESFIMQSYDNQKVYFYPSWGSYPFSSYNKYRP